MKDKLRRFFNRPSTELIILLGFLLLQILLVAAFLQVTHTLPYEDGVVHLIKSITTYKDLTAGEIPYFLGRDRFYPPLLYQTAAVVYLVLPPNLLSGVLSQIPYWLILIFGLFGIGKLLFSPLTGYLAIFYYLTAPLVLWYSCQFRPDLPSAALGILTVYCLLKSDNFKDRRFSLWFGLALGLGMLLRWWVGYQLLGIVLFYWITLSFNYFKTPWLKISSFLLPGGMIWLFIKIAYWYPHPKVPGDLLFSWGFWAINLLEGWIFWLVMKGLTEIAERKKQVETIGRKPWLNFILALAVVYWLNGWIYFHPEFALMNGMLFEFGIGRSTLEWPFFGFYWTLLQHQSLYWGYLGMLLAGVLLFLFKFKERPQGKIYLIVFITAILLLFFLPSKKDRYLLLWLALAAPLAVFWFNSLGKAKIIPILGLVLLGFFYALTGWLISPQSYSKNPLLAFLNPPGGQLAQRKIEPEINLKNLEKFLAILPKKREKILVSRLCFDTEKNIPYYNFILFSQLGKANVIISPQKQLSDYQYLVYAHPQEEEEGDLTRLLSSDDYYSHIQGLKFRVISRCNLSKLNFEYRLVKIEQE